MTIRTDVLRGLALGVLVPAVFATALAAQSPAGDARWEPWLGCWEPTLLAPEPGAGAARVCVTAIGSGSAVEIASVRDGSVVARDTIDASGARRPVNARGCTGWQSANWSPGAHRVYLRSEVSCGTELKRTSSGLIAMSARSEWLDMQGATANGSSNVREMRYKVINTWTRELLPVEFADLVRTRDLTPYASVARALAGSPIAAKDVVEASKQVNADVVEAWLIERGQALDLDARTLVALANAGVPGAVTDVLIGLAYPERFALREAVPESVGLVPNASQASRYASRECVSAFDPMWMSYGFDTCAAAYGGFGYRTNGYGYGMYPYGYGYGYGYGFDGPLYTNGYFVPGSSPRKNEPPHGVAVNGRGYTRPARDGGTQSDVADRGSDRAGRSPTSGSSGGSSSSGKGSSGSGGSSGGSSSGSSSSSGRTAQARPPKPPGL